MFTSIPRKSSLAKRVQKLKKKSLKTTDSISTPSFISKKDTQVTQEIKGRAGTRTQVS